MAEQNTEDTKTPAPRRGARPFIGPAAGTSAVRAPLLRPQTPSARPVRGPFAPPTVPNRAPLGAQRLPAQAAPAPDAAPTPTAAPSELPGALPGALPVPTAADPMVPMLEGAVADTVCAVDSAESAATTAANDVLAAEADVFQVAGPSLSQPADAMDVAAHDPFAAFHSAWEEPTAESVAPPRPEGSVDASPLDQESLGSGCDGQQMWADDITAMPETASAIPTWLSEDTVAPHASDAEPAEGMPNHSDVQWDGTETSWDEGASLPSADAIVADGATDVVSDTLLDAPVDSPVGARFDVLSPAAEALSPHGEDADTVWPDQLLAEYAPYVPTPAFAPRVVPEPTEAPAALVKSELEPTGVQLAADTRATNTPDAASVSDRSVTNDVRVATMLDRLAERVRCGEIDVSFVASDAPDAAVLASVLAALLGASNNR